MHRSTGDFWRALAMIGVVCAHAAGRFEWRLLHGSWWSDDGVAAVLSQLVRFCVPMFVVMSGYGLGCSERRKPASESAFTTWLHFWRKRAARVLLPFLVWSLLSQLRSGLLLRGEWGKMALQFLEGSADYHLYFCSIILQAYLLWPLLKRVPWWGVLGLLGLQFVLASPSHLLWPSRPHIPGWCLPHWAGYFALGAKLASSPPPRARPRLALLVWSLAGLAVVLEYAWWAARLENPSWYNHFFRYTVICFGLATVWLWRASDEALAAFLARHSLQSLSARLAGVSFCVYLIHPTLLRGLSRTPLAGSFLLLFPGLLAASFGLALLSERILRARGTGVVRLCLGLSPAQRKP